MDGIHISEPLFQQAGLFCDPPSTGLPVSGQLLYFFNISVFLTRTKGPMQCMGPSYKGEENKTIDRAGNDPVSFFYGFISAFTCGTFSMADVTASAGYSKSTSWPLR